MAVDPHRARRRIDDAADDADQGRLAGAIRAEQRENLAVADVEIDVFKRLESGGVNLIETRDGNGGRRGEHDGWLKIRLIWAAMRPRKYCALTLTSASRSAAASGNLRCGHALRA